MELTNHIYERYVERVMGIKGYMEISNYISHNRATLNENILALKKYAQYLFTGNIEGKSDLCNFYIRNNIVILTNESDTKIITLYKVDLPYPEDVTKYVTRRITEEIMVLNKEYSDRRVVTGEFVSTKKTDIESIDAQIASYENTIKNLKERKTILSKEIDDRNVEDAKVYDKIKDYVNQLCNSLDFKKELVKTKVIK